jgi:hypothetical protein
MPSPASAAARVEPPTVPSSVGVASRPEPATKPAPVRPQPKPKKEAVTAVRVEKSGSVPSWVWLLIIAIVGVAAYFVGQGTR